MCVDVRRMVFSVVSGVLKLWSVFINVDVSRRDMFSVVGRMKEMFRLLFWCCMIVIVVIGSVVRIRVLWINFDLVKVVVNGRNVLSMGSNK